VKRTLVILSAAALLLFASVGIAQAAGPKKDIGTPSRSCAILAEYHAGGYTSFQDCMRTINQDLAAYRFPADPTDPSSPLMNLDQRCTELENGVFDPQAGMTISISYPFFFGEGGPAAGWPFPELTGYNHHQCEIILFTYHKLVGL
jgi:hypothetical protein